MRSAGFGVGGCGLAGSQTMHPEKGVDSDKGHVHWSLTAQDDLGLPFNNGVTLASY